MAKSKNNTLFPTLIVIVLCIGMVGLGLWQLKRAEQKKSILAEQKRLEKQQPINYASIDKHSVQKYLPIQATGQFDNQHQFLVDNKTLHGKVGYDVLTPLFNDKHKTALLVNRGWIARETAQNTLPTLPAIHGDQQITGLLDKPGNPLQISKKVDIQSDWPRVIQRIDVNDLEKQLGYNVFPYIVQLQQSTDYSYQLHWHAVYGQPARHIAYAVQWFVFTLILIIGYIILQRKESSDGK